MKMSAKLFIINRNAVQTFINVATLSGYIKTVEI
jgi:hypothetical protein